VRCKELTVRTDRTPESGLLTAAQKLNRKDIEKRYEKQIKVGAPGAG
jgi:long-subunit acyl-CoA synthetase (AMP-forming)